LTTHARAEIVVRDSPIHAVPPDTGDQASALTPDETAFSAVLGRRVTDAASADESSVRRVAAFDPAFSGAPAVQRVLTAGAACQPAPYHQPTYPRQGYSPR